MLFLLRTRALKHRSREKACKITTFFSFPQVFSKENAKKMQIFAKCKVYVAKIAEIQRLNLCILKKNSTFAHRNKNSYSSRWKGH